MKHSEDLKERDFVQSLYTDEMVPSWRKCDLSFVAKQHCRVDAVIPWNGFRFEGPELPVSLEPGQALRIRLANETGIPHMGGATVNGVRFQP